MNLHEARPWQEPLFFRRIVAPLTPFVACAVAVIAFAATTDIRTHQDLSQALAALPQSNAPAESIQYVNDYTQEVSLLTKIYATQSTTLNGLRALYNITTVLPQTMRLKSVAFPSSIGAPITITAELQSPQNDVNEFLARIARAHDHFDLSSLTPVTNSFELTGNISVPWTTLVATTAPKPLVPHATPPPHPAHRTRASHPHAQAHHA